MQAIENQTEQDLHVLEQDCYSCFILFTQRVLMRDVLMTVSLNGWNIRINDCSTALKKIPSYQLTVLFPQL